MAFPFSSGSVGTSFRANVPNSAPASVPASVPSGLVWYLAGATRPATFPVGFGFVPVDASMPGSVAGTVPCDSSKRTWNTIAEIMNPNKIILNLTINADKMSSRLNDLAKKFSTEMASAMDAAALSIMNVGKAMRPLGSVRFPVRVGFDVGDPSESKSVVVSGQVSYAQVIHETFCKLPAHEIIAKFLKR